MSRSFGQCVRVDLTRETISTKYIPDVACRHWLGGRAMNVVRLWRRLGDPVNAFDDDNVLLLSCGLLTGTSAPAASRLHVNAISPLTGLLGSSNVGGHFGAWLSRSGISAIEISGRANRPVCLDIGPDGAQLTDAETLWGLDTHATHDALIQQAGTNEIQTLAIGPGGEHLARFACIVTDYDHAAGRTGMGAVMGAKRLKAILVRRPPKSRRPTASATAQSAIAAYVRQIMQSPDFRRFSELGGAGYVQWADERKLTGAFNYRRVHFDDAAAVDGTRLKPSVVRSRGCARCPVQCKAVLRFTEGRLKGQTVFRPEFEPLVNLGAKCGLGDPQAVVYLDNLCTRLGLDSTSASTTIAFAMDLAERGLLPEPWSAGLDLSWGNSDAMERILYQMGAMEGLGGLLGLGAREAARRLGPEAQACAAHVKGLELTAYHPAALLGSALGYAISSRGGDYNNVYASLEHRWTREQAAAQFGTPDALDPQSYAGKGRLVHRAALVNIVVDSLGICKVPALSLIGTFDLENEAHLTAALTGWPLDAADLFDVGRRVAAVERLINLRQGLDPSEDMLPEMFFSGPGQTLDRQRFQEMIADFYAAMDWDDTGRPGSDLMEDIEAAMTGAE